jgi:hypothetical protein
MNPILNNLLLEYESIQLSFILNNLNSPSISIKWSAEELVQSVLLRYPKFWDLLSDLYE